MSTLLQRLRDEQAKHAPGSELQKLLCWAELHIGDQFDRISELEEDLASVSKELDVRISAMQEISKHLSAASEFARPEDYRFQDGVFSRDYSSWRNILAANGLRPDGSPAKQRREKKAAR